MTQCRKFILLMLIFVMSSLPMTSMQSHSFYDDQGHLNIRGYSFCGITLAAVAAAGYAGYQYFFPVEDKKDEESVVSNVDKKVLVSLVLALQAMAIIGADGYVEHYVQNKLVEKKKKIEQELEEQIKRELQREVDKAEEQENEFQCEDQQEAAIYKKNRLKDINLHTLLHREQAVSWKVKKGLRSYDILSKNEATELLEIILQSIPKTEFVKIPLILRLMKSPYYDAIVDVVHKAALLALQENDGVLDMMHIDTILDDSKIGPQDDTIHNSEFERRKVSFHEAGHAVVGILKNPKFVVHNISIIPRQDKRPRYKIVAGYQVPEYEPSWIKRYVGGVTSLVPVIEKDDVIDHTWQKDELLNYMKMLFAGGISEDIAVGLYRLLDDESLQRSLVDFKSRQSVYHDKEEIEKIATWYASQICTRDSFCFDKDKVSAVQSEFEHQAYQQAAHLVATQIKEIKNLANLLLEKKIIRGHEAYEIIGCKQPMYDFEQ